VRALATLVECTVGGGHPDDDSRWSGLQCRLNGNRQVEGVGGPGGRGVCVGRHSC